MREIICNSFAHARYNSNTEHEIAIHPSMVRIYNPGEFPIGYKPEDFVYENIPSKVRNPLILKTLFLSEDEEMVVNIIKANPNYSSETIGKLINKSSRSVQRIIAELKKKGIIDRIGGTRGYRKVNK